jgi:hypothetical protein
MRSSRFASISETGREAGSGLGADDRADDVGELGAVARAGAVADASSVSRGSGP